LFLSIKKAATYGNRFGLQPAAYCYFNRFGVASVKVIIGQLLINSYLNDAAAAAFNKALRMMSAALRLCFFLILLTASNSSAARRISRR
jgi:hypothetical protein